MWCEGLSKLPMNLTGLLVEERASGGRAFSDEKHLDLRGPITCPQWLNVFVGQLRAPLPILHDGDDGDIAICEVSYFFMG